MTPRQFAEEHYARKTQKTVNEEVLRRAIANGTITPDMSLRQIGMVTGIGDSPQLIRHYLMKFLKDSN